MWEMHLFDNFFHNNDPYGLTRINEKVITNCIIFSEKLTVGGKKIKQNLPSKLFKKH